MIVEAVRPVGGLVLQQNIVSDVVLGLVGNINLSVFVMIGLGDIIGSPGPSKLVEPVVRGGLWGRRSLFHAVAVSHRPTCKGCLLHFDNGLVLLPGLILGIVQVSNHTFGGDLLDLVLGPWISGRNDLGGGLLQPIIVVSTKV